MNPSIKRIADRYLAAESRKASSNRLVLRAMENFWRLNHLPGKPQPRFTPQAIILPVPGWAGTARDLERAVEEDLQDNISEAIDTEDFVIDRVDVKGTGVTFHLRPYDPDEDSAF